MTNEEREIISQFIARVGGGQSSSGFAAGSVPATQPALPPIDPEADRFIAELFNRYPEARYRITQLAFVQERALVEAQNRIKRLEWELQQARQAAQQQQAPQPQPQPQQRSGGLFAGLFGGGRQQSAPPSAPPPQWNQGAAAQQGYYQQSAPPQYPSYMQQPLPRQGSGFLGSALTTAAGVAGGMVVGNALMDLLSPHHGSGGGFGGAMAGPWGGAAETGGWGSGAPPQADQDYVDNGGWDQGPQSWDPASGGGADAGGWDQGGGSIDTGDWDQGGDTGGWDSGTDDTI